MGWGTGNLGGGSGGLNFSVKAYGSGDSIPLSAKDNEIAVITNENISGWSFSPFAPDNATNGFLWIYSGNTGSVYFNALKKNSIVIFPGSVMQFANNGWEYVDAYIYQSGEWIQFSMAWNGYYFGNGEQYENVTGGWTSDGYKYWANTMKAATVGTTLRTTSDGANTASMIGTATPVDLTDVNTIYLTVDSAYGTAQFRIMATKEVSLDDLSVSLSSGEVSVDVSSLTGNYYLAIASIGSQTYPTAYSTVSAVWRNSVSSGGDSGVALLSLDNTPDDDVVSATVDGVGYGVTNATINEEPTEETYDFTVL